MFRFSICLIKAAAFEALKKQFLGHGTPLGCTKNAILQCASVLIEMAARGAPKKQFLGHQTPLGCTKDVALLNYAVEIE